MTANQVFLGFSVLVWLGYGTYCFFVPSVVSEGAGFVATTPTATTELRAMYGGLQMALGAMALMALRNETWVKPALFGLASVAIGLFCARLAGAFLDSGFSLYTNGALGFEFIAGFWALALLKRTNEHENRPSVS